jgi:hypothetical protein
MPQFWFICEHEEWRNILHQVLKSLQLRFALDQWYPTAHCEYYNVMDDHVFCELLQKKRNIFIINSSTDASPLCLIRQPGGPRAGQYYIDPVRSGPTIRMSLPPRINANEFTWFGNGLLSHQDSFWQESLQKRVLPSPALRESFSAIKSMLLTILSNRIVMQETRWASEQVWNLYDAGRAAIAHGNEWHTISGVVGDPQQGPA